MILKKRNVTIIDFAAKGPSTRLFARMMNANFASIMPQCIAVWAENEGHRVRYICYTGREDLTGELVDWTDILIVGCFTHTAYFATAISEIYRRGGAVTVLGGPHARCFSQDAARYFDYVLGFTGKAEIQDILREAAPHRPRGRHLSARAQPSELCSVAERWRFIAPTIAKAPTVKIVPMIGSMGCPYSCSFCIDATIKYQPMGFDQIREDLRFVHQNMRTPRVGWQDPNFGVRFKDYLDTIEDAVPPGSVKFIAESSLALLSEPNLKRLKHNGFVGIMPGIESWYDFGNKSKTGSNQGLMKVRQVADHINLILDYVPFVQTNFVLGLDCDEGPEPFELTKAFMRAAPGSYPTFSLLTCYGQSAPYNLDLQRSGRVMPTPFHMLDSIRGTNVRPLHYDWQSFLDLSTDLVRYTIGATANLRRFRANGPGMMGWINLVRAGSSSRIAYYESFRSRLAEDQDLRDFLDGRSRQLPRFFLERIKADLGRFFDVLPIGTLDYNELAYLHAQPPRAA